MPRKKLPAKVAGDSQARDRGKNTTQKDVSDGLSRGLGKMITYHEAAELLACSRRTVSRRVSCGQYQAYGEGNGRRIIYHSILKDIRRKGGDLEGA